MRTSVIAVRSCPSSPRCQRSRSHDPGSTVRRYGRGRAGHRVREVHAAQRARSHPVAGSPAADGRRQPLVPRRPRQRGRGPHRLRAPVRTHDVPGLEARAERRALQAARRRRCQRHQRHHRFRPHQLLRDAAVEPARTGAVAGIGPHGLPARRARPGGPGQPAGRRAQRAPPERREPALRHRPGRALPPAVSAGPPVLRERHRLARGHPGREARGRAEVLQDVLRAEQREPRDRR